MSQETIRRICDRAVAQIPTACAEGRGQQLLERYIRDIASDRAATVFLEMEEILSRATPDTMSSVAERLEDLMVARGVELIESVNATFVTFHASAEQAETFVLAAAEAYQSRLDTLFETSFPGGGQA